ncbi:MAG: hypothetical protein R3323_00075 [Wenzhouxiangellaceae bacterium]|nr:hypothetical protein [Wenzhouxiangellaceae bacterium]
MNALRIAMLITASSLALTGCKTIGLAKPFTSCTADCTVGIDLPASNGMPQQPNATIRVKPGVNVEFDVSGGGGQAWIVFTGDTPFVDNAGNPVYTTRSGAANALKVRSDGRSCTKVPGCKYLVFDPNDAKRPVLDPYIIIY